MRVISADDERKMLEAARKMAIDKATLRHALRGLLVEAVAEVVPYDDWSRAVEAMERTKP